ncbi:O-antigen ligase family protein [Pedobacter ureilyticus]|uniref:O-antigen ligase family protein n=1 Tax=Pedobacter ureilyticus TaxID=1393051 RepID=A0ABW9J3S5_9SPHI|nr:O-antigen ligase family protein [Pedobacter helvus]
MNKKPKKNASSVTPSLAEKPIDFSNSIVTTIITFYLLIEFTPKVEIQDQMGIHWLLLSILNILTIAYIASNKQSVINEKLSSFFRNSITIAYLSFFSIAGISLFIALNPTEGLIVYNRLFTATLAFLLVSFLLFNKINVLKNIALIISLITLLQGFDTVAQFYKGLGKVPIDALINSLQGTTGNKNVFAAAFVIKLPFIVYCILTREGFLKILAILGLALCILSVFLINARAAFLGIILELVIILFAIGYVNWREGQLRKHLVTSSYIVGILFISFFISQNSLKKATENNSETYGTVTSRLGSLSEQTTAESNIRLAYWEKSIELIKKSPFIGVGYGNWKLYTPLYTNTLLNDNVFSKHPHNDFLEIAGETGVPNALIFLSIFVLALVITIKQLISKHNLETKTIAVIAFAAICGYFVDAFFNFPAERPNIQLLFSLTLAILVINWLANKKLASKSTNTRPLLIFCMIATLLCLGSIYIHASVFKSSQSQYKVDNDLAAIDNIPNAMPKYKFDEVNQMFPKIPNIGENSETIGYKKAKYLQKEKRFDEAIKLLDSVHHQMPNLAYGDYLKCNIYLEEKKLDSAYKYGKKAAYAKPRHFYYFRMASYLAMVHKDAAEVKKLFAQYNKYRQDQQSYSYYAQSLFYSDYDKTEVKGIIMEGLKLYPNDALMLELLAKISK